MRSGYYKTTGEYWVKPSSGTFAEQCDWCYAKLGYPEVWMLNKPGRWRTKSKYGIFVFGKKEDRDMFRTVWKIMEKQPNLYYRELP
jgi:hypothetical protein